MDITFARTASDVPDEAALQSTCRFCTVKTNHSRHQITSFSLLNNNPSLAVPVPSVTPVAINAAICLSLQMICQQAQRNRAPNRPAPDLRSASEQAAGKGNSCVNTLRNAVANEPGDAAGSFAKGLAVTGNTVGNVACQRPDLVCKTGPGDPDL